MTTFLDALLLAAALVVLAFAGWFTVWLVV